MCGDFNVVRGKEEHKSKGGKSRSDNSFHFNKLIKATLLIDLPRFTWFLGDEFSMSRFDRFLMSEYWWLQWLNCLRVALPRGMLIEVWQVYQKLSK